MYRAHVTCTRADTYIYIYIYTARQSDSRMKSHDHVKSHKFPHLNPPFAIQVYRYKKEIGQGLETVAERYGYAKMKDEQNTPLLCTECLCISY